jgi:CRP-like cAMP-binding protein
MPKKRIPWEEYLEKISDMLDTLTNEQRTELLNHVSVVKFKKNEIIYKEGDLPTNLLCLVSGKVKIYKEGV